MLVWWRRRKRYVEFVHRIDVQAEAKKVQAPTLACHALNEMVPFVEARNIAARIPHSRIVPLNSRNHRLQEHEPAWREFMNALNDFLQS